MACPCGDHETYGAHLRAKNLQLSGVYTTREFGSRERVKRWDRRLNDYAAARREGIQPAGTRRSQIDAAVRRSDQTGEAFRA